MGVWNLVKILVTVLVLALSFVQCAASTEVCPTIPNVVLWAWKRKEDLRFIDPAHVGVAYLACSVLLSGDTVKTLWRDQPLLVPPETVLFPVVRVDSDRHVPAVLSDVQKMKLVALILRIAHRVSAPAIQIDFDALETERQFYREVISEVKSQLRPNMYFSITALASWCLWDNWIKDVAVDETVPMMFSLGKDREKLLLYFRSSHDFRDRRCFSSLGLSLEDQEMNQLMIPVSKQRTIPVRIYVFSRTAWTAPKYAAVKSLLGVQ